MKYKVRMYRKNGMINDYLYEDFPNDLALDRINKLRTLSYVKDLKVLEIPKELHDKIKTINSDFFKLLEI